MVNPVKAWLRIDQNGVVTLTYSRSEMGQGISTALPMILAEELGMDWKDVQVEHASSDQSYGDQGTGGSGSVKGMWMPHAHGWSGSSANAYHSCGAALGC